MKTPDRINGQNDGYIEGQKMSRNGRGACDLQDIIVPRLELFCFSGQVSFK
jgi:hypothetical protein